MSKQQLQKAALESSGVSYEESLLAQQLKPSMYERVGHDPGFRQLSQDFYDRVFADTDAAWFLNIFSSSTKQEAVENQVSLSSMLLLCVLFAAVVVVTSVRISCFIITRTVVPFLCSNLWWTRSIQVCFCVAADPTLCCGVYM
jgi:hypothetical protein